MKNILYFIFSFLIISITFFNIAFAHLGVEKVSVHTNGTAANSVSQGSFISSDGRYVVFESSASNLVSDDTNNRTDIFLRDRDNGTTIRISVDNNGVEGNANSSNPAISADGRYVVFSSHASNLIAGDTNSTFDIFLYDIQADTLERVSLDSGGLEGNDSSSGPSISSDGRYVAFESSATNFVAGDTNATSDIFVKDRQTGAIDRVSVSSAGLEANSLSSRSNISANGEYVVFQSLASNLVDVDGGGYDIFVRDLQNSTTERVSISADGGVLNTTYVYNISSNGRYIPMVFTYTIPYAGNIDRVFYYDRDTDTMHRVSTDISGFGGNASSFGPFISSDGQYIVFHSMATNLVNDDTNGVTDLFLYNMNTSVIERISVNDVGVQGSGTVSLPSISSDGSFVTFRSSDTNIVSGDTNGFADIFVLRLFDLVAPVISEATPITDVLDLTPSYSFNSDEAGTITYGGSCSSATTVATVGTNTIIFNTLPIGTYDDCTITVTDSSSNVSNVLRISRFSLVVHSGGNAYVAPVTPVVIEINKKPSENVSQSQTPVVVENETQNSAPVEVKIPEVVPVENQSVACDLLSREPFILKYGMSHSNVQSLQKILNCKNFTLALSGFGSSNQETFFFGPLTQKSVINFQISRKIKVDGIVGPETRGELNKS